ncbi:gas vesicle protein [Streptomyces radicis]|uniref:Gas vesicle protein n=1 Tax=Streptomyces radicis TaxID=1750517 RepID=A0A3A9W912_9ACTN|nr:gas vesicle protein [Streptomyces radicis]RKN09370.1 gas vesicle protein [Streptomyces radicis]RKN23032.1 gas vesicle protein [Streptomyces radicis]
MTQTRRTLEAYEPLEPYPPRTANLADILERILDKGIVIAGDIKIDLLDIELLTIRLRLFISSVDTARKAGVNWWETEPALSTRANQDALADENRRLRERLDSLETSRECLAGDTPRAKRRKERPTP